MDLWPYAPATRLPPRRTDAIAFRARAAEQPRDPFHAAAKEIYSGLGPATTEFRREHLCRYDRLADSRHVPVRDDIAVLLPAAE